MSDMADQHRGLRRAGRRHFDAVRELAEEIGVAVDTVKRILVSPERAVGARE